MGRVLIGQMLKQAGLVADDQLASALAHQRQWGCRLGESLLRLRMVTAGELLAVAARQAGVPPITLGDRWVPAAVLQRLPRAFMARRRVLPLEHVPGGRAGRLVVAFAAADDLALVDEVAFAAGLPVDPVLATEEDLACALARHGVTGPQRAALCPIELPPEPDEPMQLVSELTRCA
ncbi:general secretion pathway protein GspE [Anaeromyxobacter diazotrophicus]|uniref:Type II secretion system protein GspE N-terminal domain-containing protein n=1 Tax=Anaeromyxobacter diazotrophicus TaxID=2590199 RepID=A0A7I9VPU3_9BACT|nr:general secretion pathway protein GspE [Anaeromyxobacter diazotrophicus]GEJ58258.1 hypothetical protein AMYX_29990 [Anaeromyxobacter diazotrophicus]